MSQVGTEQFREACQRVDLYCKDGYAKAYARRGVEMVLTGASRDAIHTQALYVLSNLSHWRGAQARQVKTMLKEFIGE